MTYRESLLAYPDVEPIVERVPEGMSLSEAQRLGLISAGEYKLVFARLLRLRFGVDQPLFVELEAQS